MLSVIVAVHNQIGHNQLFLQGIRKYTTGPYEVVVIDNHSWTAPRSFSNRRGAVSFGMPRICVIPSP